MLPAAPQSATSSHHRSLWRKEKHTYGGGDFSAKWEHLQKKSLASVYNTRTLWTLKIFSLFPRSSFVISENGDIISCPAFQRFKFCQTVGLPSSSDISHLESSLQKGWPRRECRLYEPSFSGWFRCYRLKSAMRTGSRMWWARTQDLSSIPYPSQLTRYWMPLPQRC